MLHSIAATPLMSRALQTIAVDMDHSSRVSCWGMFCVPIFYQWDCCSMASLFICVAITQVGGVGTSVGKIIESYGFTEGFEGLLSMDVRQKVSKISQEQLRSTVSRCLREIDDLARQLNDPIDEKGRKSQLKHPFSPPPQKKTPPSATLPWQSWCGRRSWLEIWTGSIGAGRTTVSASGSSPR